MMRWRDVWRGLVGAALALSMLGCAGWSPFPEAEIPAALQALLDDPDAYVQPSDYDPDGLPDATPDADAALLSGCWATFREPGGEIPVQHFMVLRFEPESGEVTHYTLERDPFGLGLLNVVVMARGTYEVTVEDGELNVHMTMTGMWATDPDTGLLVAEELPEDPDESDSILRLNGEYLWVSDYEDDSGQWWWIYRRFDCPE